MGDSGGNGVNMNGKGTMNVVLLALMIEMMDKRINSAVHVQVFCY